MTQRIPTKHLTALEQTLYSFVIELQTTVDYCRKKGATMSMHKPNEATRHLLLTMAPVASFFLCNPVRGIQSKKLKCSGRYGNME